VTRPLSLQARSLAAAGFALAAFLGLAFVALDRAFHDAAISAQRERLQGYIYAYLAGADTARTGTLIPPEVGPDPRFERPSSGLYAAIVGDNIRNATDRQWRSASAIGADLPFAAELPAGEVRFEGPLQTPLGELYVLSQGIEWSVANRPELKLTFHVAEDGGAVRRQAAEFRGTLFAWLGGLGVLLLLLLLAVLRWSLAPLRKVTADLERVERGGQEHLGDGYPPELSGLATNLNAFIDSERDRLKRYRNTLSDLAHSLKTPLAVLRGATRQHDPETLEALVREQTERIGQIVDYQLQRAATSGRTTLLAPVAIAPALQRIVRTLEKVYAERRLEFAVEADAALQFRCDESDLLELCGNLLDNACKWAAGRVEIAARLDTGGLTIAIDDDGQGIAAGQRDAVLRRGVRADQQVPGSGLGLSIVGDLAQVYGGGLRLADSPLGGLRALLSLPAANGTTSGSPGK